MTREEVMILDMEGCEERAAKIAEETREASEEMLAELSAELDMIEERKAAIKAEAEEKRAKMQDVINGAKPVEEAEEERKIMDKKEIRASKEYASAFVEYLKNNCDMSKLGEETRALLTENAEEGTIAVPVGVQEKINTAWESNEIVKRITRTFFKGNLKVGYEVSATGAVFHTEGGEAVDPQTIVINYAELIPAMAKKVVEVSDEVLGSNEALLDYLYDELEYHVVELIAETVVAKIVASSLSETYTIGSGESGAAAILGAEGLLGGEAKNPVVITTRANATIIKKAALAANYAYDPFDGMEVLYTSATALGDASFIVADLSGFQANFPNGDGCKFKFDDNTKADEDIVRIIARLYVGMDVVAPGKFVVATEESE